jgi:type VI secretion system protein ImpK
MRESTAKLVYPVLMHGLRLRERLDYGEAPDLEQEQAALKGLLGAGTPAGADLSTPTGLSDSGDPSRLGQRPPSHYALVCWLDEIFSDQSPWGARWTEHTLELALYRTRVRAYKFWEQARRAEAAPGGDDLEVFYLCVMLGFRGDLRDQPDKLGAWCDAVARRLAEGRAGEWRLPEREPPGYAPPLRGRERLQRMLSVAIAAGLLLVPAVTFFLVWTLAQ